MSLPSGMNDTAPFEVISSRVIPWPRETVFAAFSDPAALAVWWGPEGFTNTFEKFDFTPGGDWIFVMHGPNGADYDNHQRFLEIVPPEKIACHHLGSIHEFFITMTYEAVENGTRLVWHMQFTEPHNEKFREFILQANDQNYDRLEHFLASGGKSD